MGPRNDSCHLMVHLPRQDCEVISSGLSFWDSWLPHENPILSAFGYENFSFTDENVLSTPWEILIHGWEFLIPEWGRWENSHSRMRTMRKFSFTSERWWERVRGRDNFYESRENRWANEKNEKPKNGNFHFLKLEKRKKKQSEKEYWGFPRKRKQACLIRKRCLVRGKCAWTGRYDTCALRCSQRN